MDGMLSQEEINALSVSYTHLDVYKRQEFYDVKYKCVQFGWQRSYCTDN